MTIRELRPAEMAYQALILRGLSEHDESFRIADRSRRAHDSFRFKSFALEKLVLKMGASYCDEEQKALRLLTEHTR